MRSLSRRRFIATSASAAVATSSISAPKVPGGIIDTHTHFYDTERPEGVPWPGKNSTVLYKPTLPKHFLEITKDQNVSGTVVVEASEWEADNQWLLDLANDNKVIVAVVGRLDPSKDTFRKSLARLAKNPLYRGIRLGTWGFKPEMLKPLDALVDHDLSLDMIMSPDRFDVVLALAKRLPKLRIIMNHLASPPKSSAEKTFNPWKESLQKAADHPNIFLKFSGIVESSGIKLPEGAPKEIDAYRHSLDVAWSSFGADKLIYGSNWPVCAQFAPYTQVQDIALKYIQDKTSAAVPKVFHQNASDVYRWVKR